MPLYEFLENNGSKETESVVSITVVIYSPGAPRKYVIGLPPLINKSGVKVA